MFDTVLRKEPEPFVRAIGNLPIFVVTQGQGSNVRYFKFSYEAILFADESEYRKLYLYA